MLSLISGIYDYFTQKREFRILVLGLSGAGKTTLVEKTKEIYTGKQGMNPRSIQPTVGINIRKIGIGGDVVAFWDLAGEKDFHKIWNSYYSNCHGVLFVVDSCAPQILLESKDTFEKLMRDEELQSVPVVILANKMDCTHAIPLEEIKEHINKMVDLIDNRDMRVLPSSAFTGDGIKFAIDWLYKRMDERGDTRPPIFVQH